MELGNVKVSFIHLKSKKNKHIGTECTIINPSDDKIMGTGFSSKSKNDSWNRNTGRKVALGYALQYTNLTKKQRTNVWKDYFSVGSRI